MTAFRNLQTNGRAWKLLISVAAVCVATSVALTVVLASVLSSGSDSGDSAKGEWQQHKISASGQDIYLYNAVSSDSSICSTMADYVMNVKGGNAVDAAVTAVLCVGVTNVHSAGIGGGAFMVVYNRSRQSVSSYNFREAAPAKASRNMYTKLDRNSSLYGGLSVAIPGEVAGLVEVHRQNGRLRWSELVLPVVELLRRGQKVTVPLAGAIQSMYSRIPDQEPFIELKRWLMNKKTGKLYVAGDLLKDEILAQTMQKISDNPEQFYNGTLADDIVDEIQEAGGIIDKNDLINYQTKISQPITIRLKRGLRLLTLPPPSSGVILSFILNIMDQIGDGPEVKKSLLSYSLFLHRLIESFKFAYAKRSALGDADFVNVTELMRNLTSESYAEYIRQSIDDSRTHGVNYYGPSFDWAQDSGTTHVSIIDSDGNAVAVTSTINTRFGSLIRGSRTGIIYNNEMDDFSSPNRTNIFGLPPSPTNFIFPGKRPMSSMAPVIIIDDAGDVQFVSGASGGSRITSAIAYNLVRQIFLNETVKEAADAFRIHHQLVPNGIQYNPTDSHIPIEVRKILNQKGHEFYTSSSFSVVEGIQRLPDGRLQANADFRKPSKTGGF